MPRARFATQASLLFFWLTVKKQNFGATTNFKELKTCDVNKKLLFLLAITALLSVPLRAASSWLPQSLPFPLRGAITSSIEPDSGAAKLNFMNVGNRNGVFDAETGRVQMFPNSSHGTWVLHEGELWQWQSGQAPKSHILRRFNARNGTMLGEWRVKAKRHPVVPYPKANDRYLTRFLLNRQKNRLTLQTIGHTFSFNLRTGRVQQTPHPFYRSDSGYFFVETKFEKYHPEDFDSRQPKTSLSSQRFRVDFFSQYGYGWATNYVAGIVDIKTGNVKEKFSPDQFSIFVLSKTGSEAFLLGAKNWTVYNLQTGQAVRQLPRASSQPLSFARVSPDGKTLFSLWGKGSFFRQRAR